MEKRMQETKREEWIRRIKACQESGKSVKSWCQEQKIGVKSYYSWRKRIQMHEELVLFEKDPPKTNLPTFVALSYPVSEEETEQISFIPEIIVHIKDIKMEIGKNTSKETLSMVWEVVCYAK